MKKMEPLFHYAFIHFWNYGTLSVIIGTLYTLIQAQESGSISSRLNHHHKIMCATFMRLTTNSAIEQEVEGYLG